MLKFLNKPIKSFITTASVWTLFVVFIEIYTELTGFRKYKLLPEPKTFLEVIDKWPIFLFSGIVTFLIAYFWQHFSKRK